jgi:hypothetical protein
MKGYKMPKNENKPVEAKNQSVVIKTQKESKSLSRGPAMPPSVNVDKMINLAIQKNLDIDKLERLITLADNMKKDWSKEQYYKALSLFQSKCPTVEKKSKAKGNKFSFNYAPLEDIVTGEIKKLLLECGLSYSFASRQNEKTYTSICRISHRDGYSEEIEFEVPFEDSQYMSSIQRMGSTRSYANRYNLQNALGIVVKDEDKETVKENEESEKLKKEILFKASKLKDQMTQIEQKHFYDLNNSDENYTDKQYQLDLEFLDTLKDREKETS